MSLHTHQPCTCSEFGILSGPLSPFAFLPVSHTFIKKNTSFCRPCVRVSPLLLRFNPLFLVNVWRKCPQVLSFCYEVRFIAVISQLDTWRKMLSHILCCYKPECTFPQQKWSHRNSLGPAGRLGQDSASAMHWLGDNQALKSVRKSNRDCSSFKSTSWG